MVDPTTLFVASQVLAPRFSNDCPRSGLSARRRYLPLRRQYSGKIMLGSSELKEDSIVASTSNVLGATSPSASLPRRIYAVSELTSHLNSKVDSADLTLLAIYQKKCRACHYIQRQLQNWLKDPPSEIATRTKFFEINAEDGKAGVSGLGLRATPMFIMWKGPKRIDHFCTANRELLKEHVFDNL